MKLRNRVRNETRTKMITASVIGLMAVSMFHAGAANAAETPSDAASSVAEVKELAVDVYNELSAAADPQRAYAGLTAEARAAFDGYFLAAEAEEIYTLTQVDATGTPSSAPKRFETESEAIATVAASASCWLGTSKYTAYAAIGNAIWDTWTEGVWCGNGSTVTSADFTNSWSTIAAVGWRDGGQIGSGEGIAGGQARMWSQRRMILGVGGWDVQTQQPCNRLNGTASGGGSSTWSCSIA